MQNRELPAGVLHLLVDALDFDDGLGHDCDELCEGEDGSTSVDARL
jgi:hypothetical protein